LMDHSSHHSRVMSVNKILSVDNLI
jgi:hypothetical protein